MHCILNLYSLCMCTTYVLIANEYYIFNVYVGYTYKGKMNMEKYV